MIDLFFGGQASWFTYPALLGTAFFLLRMVLLLMGGDAEGGDADFGDGDIGDADFGDATEGSESDSNFRILSIQAVVTFAMGFGWAGLGAYRGFGWDGPKSAMLGVAGGVAMVWLLVWMMSFIYSLRSSGNVSIRQAEGASGKVEATIPSGGGGRGRVRVVVGDRQRVYNAVSADEELKIDTRIRVVRANSDNTLTVERA